MLVFIALAAVILAWIGREHRRIQLEKHAYQELRALGASGDDWFCWREVFWGRDGVPIIELSLPRNVPLDVAMPHLLKLYRLEVLDVSGAMVTDQDLQQLTKLNWIRSVHLSSTGITDEGIKHLSRLQNLRRIYVVE